MMIIGYLLNSKIKIPYKSFNESKAVTIDLGSNSFRVLKMIVQILK